MFDVFSNDFRLIFRQQVSNKYTMFTGFVAAAAAATAFSGA